MAASLRDTQRRFERRAPMPIATREFLRELADALADSGPRELGVPADRWLKAVRTADRAVAGVDSKASSKAARSVKRSIRELERSFSGKNTRRINVLRVFGLAVLIGFPAAIVAGSHDKIRAALWIAGVIAALTVLGFVIHRYEPNVNEAGTWLGLPDRQLFAHSVKAPPSELKSYARAKLGMYIHPVLIATDRRLVLARPVNEVPGRPDSDRFEFAWEIPYRDITTFSSLTTRGESPTTTVSVHSPGRDVSYTLPPEDGKALAAIIERRASEAMTESAAASGR